MIEALEFGLGMGKVGIANTGDLLPITIPCLDWCTYSIMHSPGYEFNARITNTLRLNEKHKFISGLGYSYWNYEVDVYSTVVNEITSTEYESMSLINILMGYRYIHGSRNDFNLIFESMFNIQIPPFGTLVALIFSVEPGIGLQYKLNDRLTINSMVGYRVGLNDISYDVSVRLFANTLGARFGL